VNRSNHREDVAAVSASAAGGVRLGFQQAERNAFWKWRSRREGAHIEVTEFMTAIGLRTAERA